MICTNEEMYRKIAALLPSDRPVKLLDLGCCTDLEYSVFMDLNPQIKVTGVKEEESLKEILRKKSGKRVENLRLIYGDYLQIELGEHQFDVAMTMMKLNEFTRKSKLSLYKKVYQALSQDGIYIEWDYIGKEQEITGGINNVFSNQISLLLESGFRHMEKAWHGENRILLKAMK